MPEKQKQLFSQTEIADTFWKRFFGLMGRKTMTSYEALLIPGTKSVHTFFMRFPIDLIWFDKNKKIVKISENVKPWSMAFCWKAKGVLEVFGGEAKRKRLEVGFKLFSK